MAEELLAAQSHNLMLENRSRLHLTGVTDVDSFDETTIVVHTVRGELTIGGSELHINNLNTENGALTVEGTVTSLFYMESAPKGSGLLSRLFK